MRLRMTACRIVRSISDPQRDVARAKLAANLHRVQQSASALPRISALGCRSSRTCTLPWKRFGLSTRLHPKAFSSPLISATSPLPLAGPTAHAGRRWAGAGKARSPARVGELLLQRGSRAAGRTCRSACRCWRSPGGTSMRKPSSAAQISSVARAPALPVAAHVDLILIQNWKYTPY